ncbi:MAG: carboxypeptidase-like regulatory domain-containing protein [Planctomycetaceae bacterium]|nr:carboxypeptidase-like regulatory domain-containing protein [Planctomycetaceae bacterium]
MKRRTILFILFLVNVTYLSAQNQVKISGTVVDQRNEPLIGVSILEKGTNNGTVTDV